MGKSQGVLVQRAIIGPLVFPSFPQPKVNMYIYMAYYGTGYIWLCLFFELVLIFFGGDASEGLKSSMELTDVT